MGSNKQKPGNVFSPISFGSKAEKEREQLYEKYNQWKSDKGEGISNGNSYNCFVVIQKIKEWRSILEDPGAAETQKKEINKKLDKILEVIFTIHGGAKVSDELISKSYYTCLNTIQLMQVRYDRWCERRGRKATIKGFISDPNLKKIELIEGDRDRDIEPQFIFEEGFETIVEKVRYIVEKSIREEKLWRPRPSDLALEFTARKFKLSEERTKKKIKKIYQIYR